MQLPRPDVAARVGFADLRLADTRGVRRPDIRPHALQRRSPPVDRIEAEVDEWLRAVASGSRSGAVSAHHALGLLHRPVLTADMLAPGDRDVIGWVNLAAYTLLAKHARSLRLDALGHKEHVAAAVPALAAAREFAGVEIDLVSGGVSAPGGGEVAGVPETGSPTGSSSPDRQAFEVQAHARRAVGSVDYEQFGVASPLEAAWLDAKTPLCEMVAGLEDPHLFLAVRTAQQIRQNYGFAALHDGASSCELWCRLRASHRDLGRGGHRCC